MSGKKPGKASGSEEKATPEKRKRVGGRQKGTPNKISRDVKDAILDAFEELGGASYLVWLAKVEPTSFATLLGKVLPIQITGKDGADFMPSGFIIEVVGNDGKKRKG